MSGARVPVTRPWTDIHPKVAASGLAGAVAVILVWVLHQFLNVDPPPEVTVSAIVVFQFVIGYLVPGDALTMQGGRPPTAGP